MIVDGILIATGIGKGAQMVAWGLVTALDIYQFIFNDYATEQEANEPTWQKLLGIGLDAMGFVFAAAAAKTAKTVLAPVLEAGAEDTGKVTEIVAKNPEMKSVLQRMGEAIKSVPQKLASVQASLVKTFPKGAEFIGSILGKLSGAIKGLWSFIVKITGGVGKLGKGVRAGILGGGLTYALDPERKAEQSAKDAMNKLYSSNTTQNGTKSSTMSDDDFMAQINSA